MEITFIRHTSVAVAKGTCYGQSDVPLAESFESEAEVVKLALAGRQFDAAYSSPLTRARRLAEYCGFGDATLDDRLMEMFMGDWEMRRFDDIDDSNLQRWYDDYMNVATTGGESFPMLYQRVASFIDHLKTLPHRHVAVFAHGGTLMCAGIYAQLFTPAEAFDHLAPYGGMITIRV